MAEYEVTKTQSMSSNWWWLEKDGSSIHQNRSPWLQSEIAELNEKTKAMLELIEADAESFTQRADVYFEKRPQLINLVEDLYRSHNTLAVRFDLLKSHSLLTKDQISSEEVDSDEEYPQVQPIDHECTNLNNQKEDEKLIKLREEIERMKEEKKEVIRELNMVQLLRKEEGEEKDELTKLREEMEKIKEENKKQIMYKERDNNQLNMAIELLRKEEEEEKEELKKLTQEMERIKEEKEQIMYKEKENKKVISQLNMAIELLRKEEKDELMKLREEMERVKEENERQKEKLMQKDEEKKEVIRQLSIGMDLLRQENVNLRKLVVAYDVAIRGGRYSKLSCCR